MSSTSSSVRSTSFSIARASFTLGVGWSPAGAQPVTSDSSVTAVQLVATKIGFMASL